MNDFNSIVANTVILEAQPSFPKKIQQYLFELADVGGNYEETIVNLVEKHKFKISEVIKSPFCTYILTSIILSNGCIISEFPGNCSLLILSNVQTSFKLWGEARFGKMLDLMEDLCKTLNYRGYIISGTDLPFKEFLTKIRKFKVVLNDLFNYHSNTKNWFVIWYNNKENKCQKKKL
jgi:hypothetical protein